MYSQSRDQTLIDFMKNNTKLEETSKRFSSQVIKRKSISWLKNTSSILKMLLSHMLLCMIADSILTSGVKCSTTLMRPCTLTISATISQSSLQVVQPQFISMNNTHTWPLHGFMMKSTWMRTSTTRILNNNISIKLLTLINTPTKSRNNSIRLTDYEQIFRAIDWS